MLTRGSFVEMAVCAIDQKILTFEPNYINEPFTEVWGIPVAGEMKTAFHEKCSELSTFLIHRQSKDRMSGLIEQFSRQAFNSWVSEGMQGDANAYAIAKAADAYFSQIFRFEMTQAEGSYGTYFFISTSCRPPANEFETAALKAARQIYEAHAAGAGYCTDRRLVENQEKCFGGSIEVPELASSPAIKQIKGK